MQIDFVDLKRNYNSIKDKIQENFDNLFKKCDFINGESVKIFENNFAKYLDIKHFIGCGNGTDALEIAIKALNLSGDDEVIVQGNTYIATCLGVLNNNVKLVLCDIDEDTHMIDINKIEEKITKNTKAIIVVHLYGSMPNMDKLTDITKKHNLFLIEDCAQAHGALWNGKRAGSFGDLACFSFYPGKNLGAYGDAGGIGTNDDILNDKIRLLTNIGCKIKYCHEIIGRNSRLDTLQASFLNVKLEYLDKCNELRRYDANLYSQKLQNVGDIKLPVIENGCTPVFHLYVIKTKHRDELKKYLEIKKIQALIHYPISIVENEAMSQYNFNRNDVINCINNSHEILSLPMFPELELHEIDYICDSVKQFYMENNLLKINSIKNNNKPGELNYLNNVNFNTKRFFYINNFESELSKKRGFHANINFNELLIIIEGKIKLKLIDINEVENIIELSKNDIYYIPIMKWIEYEILESNTIILCLVDKIMSESCSIHDYSKFIKFTV